MAVSKAAPKRVGATRTANGVKATTEEDLNAYDVEPAYSDEHTIMSDMLEDLAKSIEVEPIKLVVPGRPHFHVLYNPNISYEEFDMWQKRAIDRRSKDKDLNQLKLAITVLSNLGIGLLYKGSERFDTSGDRLALSNNELHKWLGVPAGSTGAAIRKLYGSDGHILITMNRLFKEAGFDPDTSVDEDDDPLDDSESN